MNLSKLN